MSKTIPRKSAVSTRRTPNKRVPARKAQSTGRTRRFETGDHVVINGKAPNDYKGREGFITELGPGKSEYRVEFDDGRRPTTGYLPSSWLTAEP